MSHSLRDLTIELLIEIEGGYVNDPRDPGGETKYGISKRSYPLLEIKDLTKEQAFEIYKIDFWDKWKVDRLPLLLQPAYFDCAVNSGPAMATRLLQRTLAVKEDGIFGSETARAIEGIPEVILYQDYMAERAKFYFSLSGFKWYGTGWLRRLFAVAHFTAINAVIQNRT